MAGSAAEDGGSDDAEQQSEEPRAEQAKRAQKDVQLGNYLNLR